MAETFSIEMTADFGGGGTTGVFEAFTEVVDEDTVRTGYLLDNQFDEALSILTDLLDAGDPDRKGIFLDLGGGQHAVTMTAEVSSGAKPDGSGGVLQWGSSPDDTVFDATTATGESSLRKAQIFQHYVRVGGTDSLTPATLRYGEYHEDGVLDPLDVVFEQPSFERIGPDKHRFSCTFVEAASLDDPLDGSKQTEW